MISKQEAVRRLKRMEKFNEFDNQALEMAIVALINTTAPERWRDAEWPRDASNPPKEARFRDNNEEDWNDGWLIGHNNYWYDEDRIAWQYCQVRDE
jgi:hypothetical protein